MPRDVAYLNTTSRNVSLIALKIIQEEIIQRGGPVAIVTQQFALVVSKVLYCCKEKSWSRTWTRILPECTSRELGTVSVIFITRVNCNPHFAIKM